MGSVAMDRVLSPDFLVVLTLPIASSHFVHKEQILGRYDTHSSRVGNANTIYVTFTTKISCNGVEVDLT